MDYVNDLRKKEAAERAQARKACMENPLPEGSKVKVNGSALYVPETGWRGRLITTEKGAAKTLLANAILALRYAPEWSGVLSYDEFSMSVMASKPLPWGDGVGTLTWSDQEDRLTANWMQHNGISISDDVAAKAVQTVALDRPFHPVRKYLNDLVWDKKERIDGWLNSYLTAELNDYTRAVGSRWLMSAVARIFEPGCKADCCLVLEGFQGIKKSTALRTLAEPWFTDELADLGSKDAAMQTMGVWIIELSEVDRLSNAEVSHIKAFMSRSTDRFRPPYGRRLIESPRQCVFAASGNKGAYLRDETGARRFWPVACLHVKIDELKEHRDQLWAEAVARYRAGKPWWMDTPDLNKLAEDEQADRYEGGPWDELIRSWATGRTSVSISEILTACIVKPPAQWTQPDKNAVARSLRALGWERYRAGERADREWRYRPCPPPKKKENQPTLQGDAPR